MSSAQYVDQRGVQIPTADELARRDAANKLIYDGKRAEEARMVAAHRGREADKAAREAEEQERADADLAALLAPWQKEHDRLTQLVKRAEAQAQHALAKSDNSPLDTSLASDAQGAMFARDRLEGALAAHAAVKPS